MKFLLIVIIFLAAFSPVVYGQQAPDISYQPTKLIITLNDATTSLEAKSKSFDQRLGAAMPNYQSIMEWAHQRSNIAVISIPEDVNEGEFIENLNKNPNIRSITKDYVLHVREHVHSTDPSFPSQSWNYNTINILDAWHHTTGDPDIVVAIIDTGVDWNHQDLKDGIWENDDSCNDGADNDANTKIDDCRGWDFVNDDNDPMDDDTSSHGTFVAGIVAAQLNNNLDGVGVAPSVSLMPIKVLDSQGTGSFSDILDGMLYAVDNGADIINLSLGSDGSCSPAMQSVLNTAHSGNVLVIHAAGEATNQNRIDVEDTIASCNNVVSVTATDNLNQSTSYADWVDTIDLAAPGGDFAGPNTSNPNPEPIASTFRNDDFRIGGIGTSFAAPHVAGCAALVLSVNSTLSFDQTQSILESTALDLTDSGHDPNLATTGKDKVFGHGLLQCDQAVLQALGIISNKVTLNDSISVTDFVKSNVSCVPPQSGDWIVSSSCVVAQNSTAPSNVVVSNGASLIIPSGMSLDIDFAQYHIIVKSGGSLLIESGGSIQ